MFLGLSSLTAIPPTDDGNIPLKIYHKSLIDYLSSKHRSGDLYFDRSSMDAFVADRCVRVLRSASSILLPAYPRPNMRLLSPDKGPVVPIQGSPNNTGRFLDVFYHSALINFLSIEASGTYTFHDKDTLPFPLIYKAFLDFLRASYKNPDSAAGLAQCDVAWWTRVSLAHLPYKTDRFGAAFVSGMYCGIHFYMVSGHESMVNSSIDGQL